MDRSRKVSFASRRRAASYGAIGLVLWIDLTAVLTCPALAGAQQLGWMDKSLAPDKRADLLIAAMTLDQKIQQLHGQPGAIPELAECGPNAYRHIPGIPELNIPTFRITNGPLGVGSGDCNPKDKATAAPVSLALAASFDPTLAYSFGRLVGGETRTLGMHELEAPGMDLGRVPQGGRNFEYLGEDPYLAGVMAVNIIKGIQSQGIIAMAKHYALNEQEADRRTVSVVVDDRSLNEIYLLPFEMSVKDGGVASVMCSYNRIAGVYACENPYLLNTVLRKQWGFKGYVQSDFGATHSTAASLNAGLDIEMPRPVFFQPEAIRKALEDGSLKMATIDQALKRRYTEEFKAGIFERPMVRGKIDAAANGALARNFGEQTSVLLKNTGLLPLNGDLKKIALVGQSQQVNDAGVGGGGSSVVTPLYTVTPLQGLENTLKSIGSPATVNLTIVADDLSDLPKAVEAAKSADIAIVFAGVYTKEGEDRPALSMPNKQDELIAAIAAANPRTVIVLKDLDPVLMPWIDKVQAVLETFNAGQEEGNVVGRLLFGLVNPSGKLPITYPRSANETAANTPERYPGLAAAAEGYPKVYYNEGLEMGYRWFQAQKIEPLFPFGFGLSYTTFRISGLRVTPKVSDGKKPVELRFMAENTGKREGAEVAQVYLGLPAAAGEPPKRLVAFEKVLLKPGEQRQVRIQVDPAANGHPMSIWDSKAQRWIVPSGEYQIYVGNSSASIVQTASLTVQ